MNLIWQICGRISNRFRGSGKWQQAGDDEDEYLPDAIFHGSLSE
jgi:hypothetical protein